MYNTIPIQKAAPDMTWNDIDCNASNAKAVICNIPSESCYRDKWQGIVNTTTLISDDSNLANCDMIYNDYDIVIVRYNGYNDGYGIGWKRMIIEMNFALTNPSIAYNIGHWKLIVLLYNYDAADGIAYQLDISIIYDIELGDGYLLILHIHPDGHILYVKTPIPGYQLGKFYPLKAIISDNGTICAILSEDDPIQVNVDLCVFFPDFPASSWIGDLYGSF